MHYSVLSGPPLISQREISLNSIDGVIKPACYCINLRCLFQTLYRNAFSVLKGPSLILSATKQFRSLWLKHAVLSGPLYVILPNATRPVLLCSEKVNFSWTSLVIKFTSVMHGGWGNFCDEASLDGKGEQLSMYLIASCFTRCITRSFQDHPLISQREIFLTSCCYCLLKGPSLTSLLWKQFQICIETRSFQDHHLFPKREISLKSCCHTLLVTVLIWDASFKPCTVMHSPP